MKRLLLFLLSCILLPPAPVFAQTNLARMLSGVNVQTGTSYTFVAADSTRITTFSNSASVSVTLPAGSTQNFGAGAIFSAKNIGAGAVTITCSSCTINSSGTPGATLTLATGNSVDLYSDGANYVAYVYNVNQPPGSGGVIPGVIDPVRKVVLYADGTAGVTQVFQGNAPVVIAQQGGDGMTATQPQGRFYQSAASASTNVVAGFEQGFGANQGQGAYTFGTVSRLVLSIRVANTANVRYWIGEADGKAAFFNGSDATYATDTPNLYYCMFRFSAGTDTTWKAVCGTSNVAQTVVDTGIAPSTTTATLFEIQNPTYGSLSSVTFSINGVTVATVSTNLPSAAAQFGQMWSADNKNTATAVGGGFFWGELFFYK